MGIIDNFLNDFSKRIANHLSDRVLTANGAEIAKSRNYRMGRQKRPLKVAQGQFDDNVLVNFTGLIADRSVSQLVGGGVSFKFEEQAVEQAEGEDAEQADGEQLPQEDYIARMWDANHKEILLHRAALSASEAGTGYLMINDPAQGMSSVTGEDGQDYPRLTLIDPAFVTIDTLPEDFEAVIRYTIQYKFINVEGKEALRRRTIEQEPVGEMTEGQIQPMAWVIVDEEMSAATGNHWQETNRLEWAYEFAPVVHWQNLPSIDSAYGEADITDDLIALQDSLNAAISNLNKSLRLGINPFRWARKYDPPVDKDGNPITSIGPDKMLMLGDDGEVGQLLPETDWEGALAFTKIIRAAMFDISRTVDIDSLEDKLGSLTNFGLRIIYQDNSTKIDTKRELFGDALEEVNRRVQIIGGFDPVMSEPVWGEFVPVNEQEVVASVQLLLSLGVISQETAFNMLKKYDMVEGTWEDEQARINGDRAQTTNLGELLLRNFNRGEGGAPLPTFGNNTQ